MKANFHHRSSDEPKRESTLAARSLAIAATTSGRTEQPIIPRGAHGQRRLVGRSVGRWASVLLASSSGDTNRAGNYVTMPRPNLAATWPPMNTV